MEILTLRPYGIVRIKLVKSTYMKKKPMHGTFKLCVCYSLYYCRYCCYGYYCHHHIIIGLKASGVKKYLRTTSADL